MLLDTCALLWLAHDPQRMHAETCEQIRRAAVVYVSAISAFEISLKHRAGKLRLPVPPRQWFEGVLEHHDIVAVGLDQQICMLAPELPPIHKDPCDRFIIATALAHSWPLVTGDQRFAEYGVQVLS